MKKINLFIVGSAKAGTTSLVDYLSQHPDIYISVDKEPNFFVDDFGLTEEEYRTLYKNSDDYKILIDASTSYLYCDYIPKRIYEYNPHSKIIIILRNPVYMVHSLWKYMRAVGNEANSFEAVINSSYYNDTTIANLKKNASGWFCNYLYLDRGFLYNQVKRYFNVFPSDNIRVYLFEDFIVRPEIICNDIARWLSLQEFSFATDYKVNEGGVARFGWLSALRNRRYPILRRIIPLKLRRYIRIKTRILNIDTSKNIQLDEAARKKLEQYYFQDVVKLSNIIGVDLIEFWGINKY